MAESVNPTTAQHNKSLESVLDSLLTDITTCITAINVLGVKLNSDGGVSDTNYATGATLVTTT